MPRPRLPLTPASSGDIAAREKDKFGSPTGGEMSFALPPPAMEESTGPSSKTAGGFVTMSLASPELHAAEAQTRSTRPLRNKSAATAAAAPAPKRQVDEFNLPPPPTRARKIIQMTPKTQQSRNEKKESASSGNANEGANGGKAASSSTMAASNGVKKKQPSATSAAGRKIARKTAHSLIERRRRSKMNEEFATLKDMIPACTGQEMHKLAILQASIDYVSYLERCVSNLKAASRGTILPSPPSRPMASSPTSPAILAELENDESMDVEEPQPTPLALSPTSPQFNPQQQSQTHQFHHTILPSPILHPSHHQQQQHHHHQNRHSISLSTSASASASASNSPAILPQRSSTSTTAVEETDHEATTAAALLMLNVDRRTSVSGYPDRDRGPGSAGGEEKGRVTSVKDLLSL
ncbi:hypothetical protein FQN54_002025 [Arachnomyces sp. PD_36]|nr:hypothetical protein FQN54_002025 [Arachnomyces sp. PD_36]